jgi:hypothetical protein
VSILIELAPVARSDCGPVRQLRPEGKCYHQPYLKKNPYGYCPDHGTGVSCPIGVGVIYGTGVKADTAES